MIESMSEAVRTLFEKYPMNHEFGLWDLKRDVFRMCPKTKFTHADTISRRLREFRYGRGFKIACIDANNSRYKKIKFEVKG
jgi:hypothetical protein